MSTMRLSNNKVHFSILEENDTSFLICHSNMTRFRVRYVENLNTGKRAFPSDIPKDAHEIIDVLDRSEGLNPQTGDMDVIVDRLIDIVK